MVLVTGGTGLVGSHLIYDLLCKGYSVKALIRENSNKDAVLKTFSYYTVNAEELFAQITWVKGDVLDIPSLEEALIGVDKVYHTAGFVSFRRGDKRQVLETNIDGTANVVNLCLDKGIEKLCFVSSIASLGACSNGIPVTEEQMWKPTKNEASYSLSKFKSEMEVWRGITEGLNAIIVNPSVILGPGNWEKGSALLFSKVAKGFAFYTNGVTGVVDVRDVTKAMVSLMESNITGERFIVSAENISYRDLFTKIAESLCVKPPYIYVSHFLTSVAAFFSFTISRKAMDIAHKKSYYSAEKLQKALNFKYLPLSQTISDIAAIYLKDEKG